MLDYNALQQMEIEEDRKGDLMGSADLNVENERRLSILERDLKHFQGQLITLRSEMHSMNAAIDLGFERVNKNFQELLIAQASNKGEKTGAGFVVHAIYIAVSLASGVVGFLVAVKAIAN